MKKNFNIKFVCILSYAFCQTHAESNNLPFATKATKELSTPQKIYYSSVNNFIEGERKNKNNNAERDQKTFLDEKRQELIDTTRIAKVAEIIDEKVSATLSQKRDEKDDKLEDKPDKDAAEGIIDKDSFEELQVVPATGKGFVYQISPQTLAGKLTTVRYLSQPVADKAILEKRQKIQKFLIENPKV